MSWEMSIFWLLVASVYLYVMSICIKYDIVPPAWGIMGLPISIAFVAGMFEFFVW
ncbi:hypothetical protein phiOC_p042 [Ochrobactrum phage vB_OspM_OC]|nr:hypothetical protein phiOC_p042 [Ochrobactrum phage vB_OspM_OC]